MSMTTIPLIQQYQFVNGRFVLARGRNRFVVFVTYFFITLCIVLSSSSSAWAPVTPDDQSGLSILNPYPIPDQEDSVTLTVAPEPEPPDPHLGIVAYIRATNKALKEEAASQFASHIVSAASEFKLDLATLAALIKVESKFEPDATSNAGAKGLSQVIPRWHSSRIDEARKVLNAYSIYEPRLNIYVGASALKEFLTSSRDIQKALLLYNGSSTDEKASYAKAVMSEARLVQRNFLSRKAGR